MHLREFDGARYSLDKIVATIFGVADLGDLHLLYDELPDVVEFKNDQSTKLHRHFYANKEVFLPAYELLMREVIRPMFAEPLLYQRVPTFRAQLPRNLGVGAWHRDADYSHSPAEINFYMPLTKAYDTNTIWAESEYGRGDFAPFPDMVYGQVMQWDGANLMHGNKLNETGKTRVSVDFRVMPMSLYDAEDASRRKTTHVGKRMVIGEYFEVCD